MLRKYSSPATDPSPRVPSSMALSRSASFPGFTLTVTRYRMTSPLLSVTGEWALNSILPAPSTQARQRGFGLAGEPGLGGTAGERLEDVLGLGGADAPQDLHGSQPAQELAISRQAEDGLDAPGRLRRQPPAQGADQ